jgi:calcium-dependent protein kinase
MGCCALKEKSPKSHSRPSSRYSAKANKSALVRLYQGSVTEHYKITKKIGDGGFGVVKLAVHKETNMPRAIKSISLNQNVDLTRLLEEVNILKSIDHPNIVKIFEVVQDSRCLNIVMEFCSGGELFDKIKATNGFSENVAAKYMFDIVGAVKYCHEANIVHRDLKPENILFESEKPDAQLKIIDFGTSQHFRPREKMRKFIGTSFYIAPEVIDKNYDEKCDVWSLGVILYIMLCGLPPFFSRNDAEIFEKIKKMPVSFKGEVWTTVSDDAKKLIQKMLRKDPADRFSIQQVYNDPWLQSRAKNAVPDKPIAKLALTNLNGFSSKNALQQITLSYIVSQLVTRDEINEIRKMFQAIDKNGDGKLSKNELQDAYDNFPNNFDFDLEEIMERCDADGSGFIDYTEFLTAAVDWQRALSNERLVMAFKLYDRDGDGKIALWELAETLGNSGLDEEVLTDMIAAADKNHDGEIDFEEFKEIMKVKELTSNQV